MILVDTSVWIDHLKLGNERLKSLLQDDQVLCHPFVIGELACGNLRNRNEILHLLEALPGAPVADHSEVLHLINTHRLYGQGLGWIDAHLLASALIAGCELWTSDRRLHTLSERLARIIHEGFYCNRRYAATTSLPAGGLATQSVNILFQVCLPPSRLRAPVSLGVSAVSSRTLVNNAG